MKLLKILKGIFGALCALSVSLGIVVFAYDFKKTEECPYCALPEGLSNEEIQAALAEARRLEAVRGAWVETLFGCFWAFLLMFFIIVGVDIYVRILRGGERSQWPERMKRATAAWWKKHNTLMTVLKCILGVLAVFSGFGFLLTLASGIVVVEVVGVIVEGTVFLMPLWILLALLGIERKIKKEKQRLSSSEENL